MTARPFSTDATTPQSFKLRPRHLPQGALLLDFLAEPLHIDSIVVATPLQARTDSIAVVAAGDEAAAAHAAAARALRRALDTRTRSLGPRLEPPFRRCPPAVAVMPVLPRDSCFRPTASRRVPSGAPIYCQAGLELPGILIPHLLITRSDVEIGNTHRYIDQLERSSLSWRGASAGGDPLRFRP